MKTARIVVFSALALFAAHSFAETHTVTFRRMNGTVLSKVEVAHGGSVTPPSGPVEADHTFKGWDHGDWLGCVTNDIQVYALYEGTKTWAKGTNYGSKNITFRDEPYSLDEYFKMYDNLAWADEFSRPGTNDVNSTYWNYDTENRHELNYETAGDNQKEHDGNLTINVRREKRTRQEFDWSTWSSQTVEYDFTGGGIKSNGKVAFKYGRCEIRAKLTRQKGCWPAFWMMGNSGNWPACGELDILEQPSGGDWTCGTLHIDQTSGGGSLGCGSVVTPQDGVHFGDGFHRFGTIMNEREVIWYVDDHIFKRMDVRDSRYHMCHDRPWFIIFGMGIQSNVWVQVPDAPATKYDVPELDERGVDFLVDYCRIFTNTNEGNTVTYQPPAASAKLSAPVKATVWLGWDLGWGTNGAAEFMNNVNKGYDAVDYVKGVLTGHLVGGKTDVLTFLTEPLVETGKNRGEFDIPGYTMMSISFNSKGNNHLMGNALFNRDRFSASESGVDFMTLSSDMTFTNCYAMCVDLKEKATGARFKVVSVNVVSTNGIENASGTVAQGFNTLFSKLNAMKNDKVIVFFQGMAMTYNNPALYNYISARAASSLQAPYTLAGTYTSPWARQCAYVTQSVSASAAQPAKIPVTRSNLAVSYSLSPKALQATVTFDELPDDGLADAFNASDYAKSMDVTFSGYSGSTLSSFPVLVKLSTAISGFSYADFQKPNGGDLRFTDASGNVLPHEIDTWNPSGVSTVWVKVPSLKANAKIVAHFGCARPVRVDSSQVWDSNYVGVWHLGESALPLKESSGVSVDFTRSSGKTIGYGAPGIVGGSVDFANGASNAVVALDHDKLDNFSKFTIEAWTKQGAHKSNAGILTKRESSQKNVSYYMYDGNGPTALNVGTNNSCNSLQAAKTITSATGSWAHQAYTVDMKTSVSNVWGYLNGVATSPKSVDFVVTVVSNRNGNLTLGNLNANANAYSFNGLIDEVRISKSVRPAAWIKATHDTVTQSDFATYKMNGNVTPVVRDPVLVVTVGAGVTNTLSAITNVTDATWITNVIKRGAGTLVASGMPTGFNGTISVEAGVWQGGVSTNDFGVRGTVIDVKDGASLSLRGATTNGLAGAVFSGKTINLYGAKNANLNSKIYVYCDSNKSFGADVTIRLKDANEKIYLDCKDWRAFYVTSGTFDLGGHKLTIESSYRRFETGATVTNGGTLEFVKTEFNVDSDERIPKFSGTGTLKTNYAINFKKLVSAPGWTLSGNPVSLHGNINRWPTTTTYPSWEGPIALAGDSKIAEYAGSSSGTSNTVFNAKGAISGSGKLQVGPGWLNLHSAANSYTGKVTVVGRSAASAKQPILAGGGGIGLWNGAACFPNASSITFTNTARLAFMDSTKCTVPNVKFIALAGETQSISGGVYTARSTIVGITKTGEGTLLVDSPAQITGLADIQAGTLKIANRANLQGQTNAEVLAPMPVFASLAFASGTKLDMSDTMGYQIADLSGSPVVTNAGLFGVTGKWTLTSPNDVMKVTGDNPTLVENNAAGLLAFAEGSTFAFKDAATETAYSNAVVAAGSAGLVVARARWIMEPGINLGEVTLAVPQPSSTTSQRWQMRVADNNTTVRLFLAPTSGYAAWVAAKGIEGAPDMKYNGIERGVRYAFDIDPSSETVGDPIIKVVRDSKGNPVVQSRDLATGRDDITFGILATENLSDWSNAVLVPMKKFETDGYWKPTASENSSYVYPAKLFFKYTIDID